MGKSIYQQYGGGQTQSRDVGKAFDEFAKNFRGNPSQELEKLRTSGQIPPQAFAMADQIAKSVLARFSKK